jgi:ubiquitin-conjugating enzyme E2 variant
MKTTSLPLIILQIILGFLLADFIGGIFHWIEDTYLHYCIETPILRDIAKDNEMHHYFPRSILTYSYLSHMTYSLPLAVFGIVLLYLLDKRLFVKYPYFIVTLFVVSSMGNIVHRFSHMRDCENHAIVKCLQKYGILCSHSHHSIHHVLSNEKYCAISEWNNYILDTILFWRGLEYLVYGVTGIKPTRKYAYDEYSPIHNHMHEDAKKACPSTPTPRDVEELYEKLDSFTPCQQGEWIL